MENTITHLYYEDMGIAGGGADLYDLKIDPSKRGPYGQKVYGFSHLPSAKKITLRHLDGMDVRSTPSRKARTASLKLWLKSRDHYG